jgi:hypothetical protein
MRRGWVGLLDTFSLAPSRIAFIHERIVAKALGERKWMSALPCYRELGHATSFKPLYPKRPKALVGLE